VQVNVAGGLRFQFDETGNIRHRLLHSAYQRDHFNANANANANANLTSFRRPPS
jgi:hypothetical protein